MTTEHSGLQDDIRASVCRNDDLVRRSMRLLDQKLPQLVGYLVDSKYGIKNPGRGNDRINLEGLMLATNSEILAIDHIGPYSLKAIGAVFDQLLAETEHDKSLQPKKF